MIPTTGGSYTRDPDTGAVTLTDAPTQAHPAGHRARDDAGRRLNRPAEPAEAATEDTTTAGRGRRRTTQE